jgi:hypothetical protein
MFIEASQVPEPASHYTQTYFVFIKGSFAGSERVTESLDSEGNTLKSSEHDLYLADGMETNRIAFRTTMLFSKRDRSLLKYTYQITTGSSKDYYEVRAGRSSLVRVLKRGGRVSETTQPLEPGTLIVDFNVFHHYDNLIRCYDIEKGGRQTFNNFLPLIGSYITLALSPLEDTELDFGKGKISVRNYKIEHVGLWSGTVSVDEDNRLVRLVVRAQDLEVLRQDVVPDSALPQQPSKPDAIPPNAATADSSAFLTPYGENHSHHGRRILQAGTCAIGKRQPSGNRV